MVELVIGPNWHQVFEAKQSAEDVPLDDTFHPEPIFSILYICIFALGMLQELLIILIAGLEKILTVFPFVF